MADLKSSKSPGERLEAWVAEFISPVHALSWPDETYCEIDTVQGKLRGVTHEGVSIFRGIRYAEPPVGDRRFAPPVPSGSWSGVKDATHYGPMSWQPGKGDFSEDCLFLNVWTPSAGSEKKLPVFVYIHGGGYTLGAGSQPLYEGSTLASQGIVVVTINYRLGTLGFLPSTTAYQQFGTTGNWGVLDMVAALQWVQKNISSFGGDPGQVTIGGESAGSYAVSTLLVSPLAEGLFSQAIMQSGSLPTATAVAPETARSLAQANERASDFFRQLGLNDDKAGLAALRQLPAEQILSTHLKFKIHPPQVDGFWPVPDDYVYRANPVDLLRQGKVNKVKLLAGFNTDEGSLFIPPDVEVSDYEELLTSAFGERSGHVLSRFPVDAAHDVHQRMNEVITLGLLRSGIYHYADALSHENDVYIYHFNFVDPAIRETGLGVIHGSEIKYIFHNFMQDVDQDNEAKKIAHLMQSAWVGFIKNGDPNNGVSISEDVLWECYRTSCRMEFEISENPGMKPVHEYDSVAFINANLLPQC